MFFVVNLQKIHRFAHKIILYSSPKMLARDLISDSIPPLKTSDTGLKALKWMEEFRMYHLPIVNNVEFLGLISEEDILSMNAPEEAIGNHKLSLIRPFVTEHQHFYEVIKMIASMNLSLVPVLNEEQHYLGAITTADILKKMAESGGLQNPGGIIVLEMNLHDYHLSEIAHIVESNDCLILNSYVSNSTDNSKIDLTLKINKTDISRILSAFYRYNYFVKASYQEKEFFDDMKKRYDSFMNYLNI